ncbi:phosphotransferase enzyme family protein [Amniculicola lignicola CBS 123094]|uniref:Phosphotransferase enzyme family protein n=1 Tax=Amniculicola lignicola CBS 123094 TaxID=1392246 RepID=A0A6A5X354_9PLEO|nr:phosphotransferase enzyme family protein [Amniculicola lignicola CBS 123094]
MPILYQPLPTSARINIFFQAPGHEIITPSQVEASKLSMIVTGASGNFARISPSMLVKYGTHVSLFEAKTLLFLAERTSIPIPKLYAAYAYGPLDRDVSDYGSVYDTYIFMEFIEGETLEKAWETCTPAEKKQISVQLKEYMTELRGIPDEGYIGAVDFGIVTDVILEWSTPSRGPFPDEDAFNAAIADAFVAESKGHVGTYIRGMLNEHKHSIVFAHGDLRPPNIMIKDGHVEAIIDWEMAGWYPEYWDFAKAFYLEHLTFSTDWATYLLDILTPYYYEEMMYSKLMRVLW